MNEINKALEALKDEDGENRAVRAFLMIYGTPGLTAAAMAAHMRRSGFDYVPAWVERSPEFLTKAGAQLWLRMLFALENPAAPAAADVPTITPKQLASHLAAGGRAELAPAQVCVTTTPEQNAEVDEKLGIELLPSIRVSSTAAGIMKRFAALEGVILQAFVRDVLEQRFTAGGEVGAPLAGQCGESCERAKLCGACARGLEEAQEPVAAQCRFRGDYWSPCSLEHHRMVLANPSAWTGYETRPLYTSPAQSESEARKPMTEAQIQKIGLELPASPTPGYLLRFARAVEIAHGITDAAMSASNQNGGE